MRVCRIGKERARDIRLPNEPFSLWGRIVPTYDGAGWDWRLEQLPQQTQMCFPDENYDYDAMAADTVFFGAYDEKDQCVGLLLLQKGFFRYMYLYDLKVCRSHRRQGVAKALLASAAELAREQGYRGIYTIGQDNNASACLFYLRNGFHIGGLDTKVYNGTAQEGKADIMFYLDI